MVYCGLISRLHWTWEYIDLYMTIPRVVAFNRFWKIEAGEIPASTSTQPPDEFAPAPPDFQDLLNQSCVVVEG